MGRRWPTVMRTNRGQAATVTEIIAGSARPQTPPNRSRVGFWPADLLRLLGRQAGGEFYRSPKCRQRPIHSPAWNAIRFQVERYAHVPAGNQEPHIAIE